MTSQNPQSHIYDPKTLAVMDQAFASIWNVLRADDPFRDYANDSELRIAIGHKLMKPASARSVRSRSVLSLRGWRICANSSINAESKSSQERAMSGLGH
jgi:hypothetical protein